MTCKEGVYAIPDNDMQAYECELDQGLRYGYDGCDAEELKAKVTEAENVVNYFFNPSSRSQSGADMRGEQDG